MSERQIGGVTILDLSGQLTDAAGALMWTRVRGLAAAGNMNVLLNLAQVSYIDSDGLGTMIAAFLAMKRVGGALKLLGPTARTRKMLLATSLTSILDAFDSEAAALRSFSA